MICLDRAYQLNAPACHWQSFACLTAISACPALPALVLQPHQWRCSPTAETDGVSLDELHTGLPGERLKQAPLLGQHGAEVLRGHLAWVEPELCKRAPRLGGLQAQIDRRIKLADDRRWRFCRCQKAVPDRSWEPVEAGFAQCRHIGK